MRKIHTILGIVMTSLMLTACGGSSNSADSSNPKPTPESTKPTQQPDKPLNEQGRLLIINGDVERPQLSLYDLMTKKIIQTTQLKTLPFALHSSPNYRYGVLMDRTQGQVSFYDSGLSLNKAAMIEQTPQLLNYQLFGASPTHYRQFNGQASIFYDGSATESSKFDVFSDLDITNKFVATENLPFKHHGVAEPLGDMVLSTFLPAGSTKVSLVKSFVLHGNHFHEDQTLENPCPGLHGAASIEKFTGFGCEDGILLVEKQGQIFKDYKLPLSTRIGTLVGHPKAPNLVGIASSSADLFVIDVLKKSINQIRWVNQVETKRLLQNYSASGEYFVVLDSTGTVTIFDAKTWDVKFRVPVLTIEAEHLAKTKLVMHGQLDEVFLNDTQNKSIIHIDLKTGAIKQRIELQSIPSQMTWLGIKS